MTRTVNLMVVKVYVCWKPVVFFLLKALSLNAKIAIVDIKQIDIDK